MQVSRQAARRRADHDDEPPARRRSSAVTAPTATIATTRPGSAHTGSPPSPPPDDGGSDTGAATGDTDAVVGLAVADADVLAFGVRLGFADRVAVGESEVSEDATAVGVGEAALVAPPADGVALVDGFGDADGLGVGEVLLVAGGFAPGGLLVVLACQEKATDWPSCRVSPATPRVEYFHDALLPSAQNSPQ